MTRRGNSQPMRGLSFPRRLGQPWVQLSRTGKSKCLMAEFLRAQSKEVPVLGAFQGALIVFDHDRSRVCLCHLPSLL